MLCLQLGVTGSAVRSWERWRLAGELLWHFEFWELASKMLALPGKPAARHFQSHPVQLLGMFRG